MHQQVSGARMAVLGQDQRLNTSMCATCFTNQLGALKRTLVGLHERTTPSYVSHCAARVCSGLNANCCV